MTTIKEVGQSIRQSDWSITIDLQDAFLHVPVYRDYRRFLRFSWNKKIYQFRRLPLGLTSSPQVFTDITTPLVEYCRIRGIRVILSRRYTGIGKHTVTALPTQRLCFKPAAPSGVQTQPEQMSAHAIACLSTGCGRTQTN